MRALQLESLGQKSQFRTHCKTVKLCVSKYNRCHTHTRTHSQAVLYLHMFVVVALAPFLLRRWLWLGLAWFPSLAMVASIDPTVRGSVASYSRGLKGEERKGGGRQSNKYSWVFLSIWLEQKETDENAVCAALTHLPSHSLSHSPLLFLLTQRPLPRGRWGWHAPLAVYNC